MYSGKECKHKGLRSKKSVKNGIEKKRRRVVCNDRNTTGEKRGT